MESTTLHKQFKYCFMHSLAVALNCNIHKPKWSAITEKWNKNLSFQRNIHNFYKHLDQKMMTPSFKIVTFETSKSVATVCYYVKNQNAKLAQKYEQLNWIPYFTVLSSYIYTIIIINSNKHLTCSDAYKWREKMLERNVHFESIFFIFMFHQSFQSDYLLNVQMFFQVLFPYKHQNIKIKTMSNRFTIPFAFAVNACW